MLFSLKATCINYLLSLLTSSNISSFSSKCLRSWRDRRCGLWLAVCEVVITWPSVPWPTDRNVGVPSIVLTMGLTRPPRSNSCAEIFRTGVVAPEPVREVGHGVGWVGELMSGAQQPCWVAEWHTSQVSTTCLVAFLEKIQQGKK